MEVQGLAGQREMRFADDLGLGWVRVDQLGHIRGFRVPVIDQLALCDELAHPAADEVDAEHASRPGAIGTGFGEVKAKFVQRGEIIPEGDD